MVECLCGCGAQVGRGREFLPGHDQKLRTEFERLIGGSRNLVRLRHYVQEIGPEKTFALLEACAGRVK